MGDGFPLIDVVLFAMVAAFLFLRLRSVLGRRTGQERQRPNPFVRPAAEQRPGQPAAPRPEPLDEIRPVPRLEPVRPRNDNNGAAGATPLATGLAEIKLADPSFDEEQFLGGARVAFETIIEAFARGDLVRLRPLL